MNLNVLKFFMVRLFEDNVGFLKWIMLILVV